jgi:hypothetical protein
MNEPMIGLWWLPESPDRRVSGALEQGPEGKFTLQTYSGLEGDTRIVGDQDIYGQVNSLPVTMRKAHWWGSVGGRDPETTREKYVCWSLLHGVHSTPDAAFSGVDIQSEFLDGWIDKHLWDGRISSDGGLKMNYFPDLESADYADGKLWLFYGTNQAMGTKHWSITRSTSLSVQPTSQSMLIGDCEGHVSHLDSLMDIIFASATSASKVNLHQPGEGRAMFGGLGLRGIVAAPKFSEPERRLHDSDGLCTFKELGELEGIAKWFSLEAKYRYLAGRITSHYRGEGRYFDDRALTAFASGEALDRVESGANSTARTRWKRLAHQIPEFVENFIGLSVEDWANGLVGTRDDLAHVLSFDLPDEKVAKMIAFSQSAHFLSILSLLRIAGLGAALNSMPTGYRWRSTREDYEHGMRAAGLM